jgi:hydrogenase-4 component H
MRSPKLRELKEAITAVFRGPYTAKFPTEPTPLPETFRGCPRFNKDKCVGCGACANVCPTGALQMEDDVPAKLRRLTIYLDRCIFCGQCQANCLTREGVKQTSEYDLATTSRASLRERVEKSLLLCEACGTIIGAQDHLLWVARRIGPVGFANPTLLLTAMQDLSLADKAPKPSADLRRGDRLRVLCPRCRQITSLIA